ncbi:MAG: hypothetical protein ACQES4_11765 [Bacillota bacterium]
MKRLFSKPDYQINPDGVNTIEEVLIGSTKQSIDNLPLTVSNLSGQGDASSGCKTDKQKVEWRRGVSPLRSHR